MLLKWLFTLLAILWLYQAIQPFFVSKPVPPPTRPTDPKRTSRRDHRDDEGDYIDYEEIK